jgi:hypothetical protein
VFHGIEKQRGGEQISASPGRGVHRQQPPVEATEALPSA